MPDKKTIARIADEGAAKYKDEAFEELVKLASIDSGHGDPVGSANMVNALEEIMMKDLKGLKFEKIVKEGFGTHILATLNEGSPNGRIIISGHTDTVFKQGDCAKFPVHIDEKDPDIAWGLGITDCKGGLVVAVKAVKVAMENGLLPDKEICFAFECDEEGGGGGGNELLHSRVIPEDPSKTLCFVFESSRDEDGVLIARKGSCGITIDVEGIRSHSGINYKAGRSAMFELAFQLMELLKYNDDERGIQFNVGRVVNDDPANVVSGHATAAISVRIANSADLDRVKEIVDLMNKGPKYYADGTKVKVTLDRVSVPMEEDEKNKKLYEYVRDCGRLHGDELVVQRTGGSGTASWYSYHGIPTVDALGTYQIQIHTHDERMRISSIEKKISLFATVLGCLKEDRDI